MPNGASTVQMAAAYATIANGGVYIEPTFYQKVTDKNGNVIMQPKSVEERSTRVMSEQNAYIVKNVMQGTVQPGGTAGGYGKIPGHDTAAKTGTTNDSFDRWYVTFTNYYAAACWYGYEFSSEVYWPGGANPAGAICSSVMKDVHAGLEDSSFYEPEGLERRLVCADSGMLAGEGCSNVYQEVFTRGSIPPVCDKHIKVRICAETGKLASEWCRSAVEEYHTLMPDAEAEGKWNTDYAGLYDWPEEICPHTAASYKYED